MCRASTDGQTNRPWRYWLEEPGSPLHTTRSSHTSVFTSFQASPTWINHISHFACIYHSARLQFSTATESGQSKKKHVMNDMSRTVCLMICNLYIPLYSYKQYLLAYKLMEDSHGMTRYYMASTYTKRLCKPVEFISFQKKRGKHAPPFTRSISSDCPFS